MSTVHDLDELGSSELPLKFGSCIVLDELDWLDLSIGCCKFTPQVSANPRSTNLQLALRHELLLEVTELQWSACCLKQLTDGVACTLVQLLESMAMNSSCACMGWIKLTKLSYSSD